jgi:hypothetical protein
MASNTASEELHNLQSPQWAENTRRPAEAWANSSPWQLQKAAPVSN